MAPGRPLHLHMMTLPHGPQVERHCTVSSGGSFIPGPNRARLFAAAVAAFSTELVSAPAPTGGCWGALGRGVGRAGPDSEVRPVLSPGASDLDVLLHRIAHRMVRRQVSLNHSWFASTKRALGEALNLAGEVGC